MPRRHNLLIKELRTTPTERTLLKKGANGVSGPHHDGVVSVMAIFPEDPHWGLLDTPIGEFHHHRISHATYQHALKGYTEPLFRSLGDHPTMTPRRLPQVCANTRKCPFHNAKKCLANHPEVPMCHEPIGVPSTLQWVWWEVLKAFHDGTYVWWVVSPVVSDPLVHLK